MLVLVLLVATHGASGDTASVGIIKHNVDVELGGTRFRSALASDKLHKGDTVRTDDTGQAEVRWWTGSVTRLDVKTRFVLGNIVDTPGHRQATGKLTTGRVWNRVSKLTTSQERFEIGSPHAVAAVRGTAFIVDCRHLPTCYFTVIEGFVEVTTSSGKSILLTAGETVAVDGDGNLSSVRRQSGAVLLRDPWIRANLIRDGKSEAIGVPVSQPEASKGKAAFGSSSSGSSSTGQGGTSSATGTAVQAAPPSRSSSSSSTPSNTPVPAGTTGGGSGGGGGGSGGGGAGGGGSGGGGSGGTNTSRAQGTVTDSTNGSPIANALVRDVTTSTSTRSASDGTYVLRGLTTGAQTIRVSKSGYLTDNDNVHLAQGANTVNVALTPTATLTGTVSDSATGTPLSGVTVAVGSHSAQSAANGTYSIANVPTGTQTVTATKSGYQTASSSATIAPGPNSLDFVMTPTPTATVSGTVTDASTSSPIAGATVAIGSRSAQTASNGTYSIASVPTGSQTITASASGYQSSSQSPTLSAGSNTVNFQLIATSAVASGTVTDASTSAPISGATVTDGSQSTQTASDGSYTLANLTTGPQTITASASGYQSSSQGAVLAAGGNTVSFQLAANASTATASGTVTDASTSSPISGATVSDGTQSTQTASDGSYTLSNLPTGSQTIDASAAGYVSSSQSVTLAAGSNTVVFRLTPAPGTANISGTVTDASTSAPISGATVALNGSDITSTASDGTYSFSGVPTGSQTIAAGANGYQLSVQNVTLVAGNNTVNFQLTPTATASGTVTDSVTTSPISGATVTDGSASTQTASDGTYTLQGLSTGSQTITASATGYQSSSQNVTLAAGNNTVDFQLTASSAGPSTERVSVASDETQGDASSDFGLSSISSDGRFVAFSSFATNLVSGDTNGKTDVFVRDRQTGTTERVSVSTGGGQSDGNSNGPSISADGRYVAFTSDGTNLVSGDTNGRPDVFVYDRQTATTARVSVSTAGAQGTAPNGAGGADSPAISADGQVVAFRSTDDNLVSGDTNGNEDIFVRDRTAGTTEWVSVSTSGTEATGSSGDPSISADGRYVAFDSNAANLVAGDTNGGYDAFVRDRQAGTTERVSVSTGGGESNGGQARPTRASISADGRYVAFNSDATNLVSGDTNANDDIFVRDRTAGTTERVSVSTGGAESDGYNLSPSISADGRFVAFYSNATTLVTGDTNGIDDVFVRDRQTGTTVRESVSTSGTQTDGNSSYGPAISADGTALSFSSDADNLVAGDTNATWDIFVRTL